ncbi:MAG: ATPase V [Treponema sp.]|jgi:V/A-type H+-transporting ATPase subunit F|nr:ATPase V [Treponema sp.]
MDYFFIGDPELLTAFRFVGVDGVSVRGLDDTRAAFLKITQGWDEAAGAFLPGTESYRVLILTEEAADWLGDDLTRWQLSGRYPLVVEVPGAMGRLEGRKTLVDSIREAVGIHV